MKNEAQQPEVTAEIQAKIADLVAQGLAPALCSGCAALMWFIPPPNTQRVIPWNPDATPHHATCPKAQEFRKPKP